MCVCAILTQKGPCVGGMCQEARVLEKELVVHADVVGVRDGQWLVVVVGSVSRCHGLAAVLCVVDDTVPAGDDAGLEGFAEGGGVVCAALRVAVGGVVEAQRGVDLAATVLVRDGWVDAR